MLTTVFGNVMREAAGGGKAWISSFTKRAAPGATIDIPFAHKDALYVRSHYDGITITLPDAPGPTRSRSSAPMPIVASPTIGSAVLPPARSRARMGWCSLTFRPPPAGALERVCLRRQGGEF